MWTPASVCHPTRCSCTGSLSPGCGGQPEVLTHSLPCWGPLPSRAGTHCGRCALQNQPRRWSPLCLRPQWSASHTCNGTLGLCAVLLCGLRGLIQQAGCANMHAMHACWHACCSSNLSQCAGCVQASSLASRTYCGRHALQWNNMLQRQHALLDPLRSGSTVSSTADASLE